jgi:hypothetical protein
VTSFWLLARRVVGVLLIAVGVGCLLAAYHTVSHLWGYQDSSTGFYIAAASVFFVFAMLSAASGIFLLKR